MNDTSYQEAIQTNPDFLFDTITPSKIERWTQILLNKDTSFLSQPLNDDSEILNTITDLPYQQVIQNDVKRTRVKERIIMGSFMEYLEFFITYYCKTHKIKYKQGLNEIIGPMILLKYKINISLNEIYNLITAFINFFLTNYYREEKFYALNSSLSLLTLLLKYHIPLIYNIFDYAMILPQMYGTAWIMTLLSGKLNLNILYKLWDYLISINDNMFIYFIIVALLKHNSDKITGADINIIPKVLTQLSINTLDELNVIISLALDIRNQTPYSFHILGHNLHIYSPNINKLQESYELYKPETLTALPIFPSEIFYITYKDVVKCPDTSCGKGIAYHHCELCEMKVVKNINYILLDLRILQHETTDERTGFLPMMIMIEQDELTSNDLADTMVERFMKDKGNYHFVFLTNRTDYFARYENTYYIEPKQESGMSTIAIATRGLTKIDKEIQVDKVEKMSSRQKLKLQEYDNLKKILENLPKANYPYVSYVYGGFKSVHENSFKYNISLLNHDPKCELCKKMRRKDKEIIVNKVQRNKQRITPNPYDDNTKHIQYTIDYYYDNVITVNTKVQDMMQLITESDFLVSICKVNEHKGKCCSSNKKEQMKVMLILDKDTLCMFNLIKNEEHKQINIYIDVGATLMKFDKIKVKNVKKITMINNNYTGIKMEYTEEKKKMFSSKLVMVNYVTVFEFNNELDGRKFMFTINQYMKVNTNTNTNTNDE